jgi:hypothetical protein
VVVVLDAFIDSDFCLQIFRTQPILVIVVSKMNKNVFRWFKLYTMLFSPFLSLVEYFLELVHISLVLVTCNSIDYFVKVIAVFKSLTCAQRWLTSEQAEHKQAGRSACQAMKVLRLARPVGLVFGRVNIEIRPTRTRA